MLLPPASRAPPLFRWACAPLMMLPTASTLQSTHTRHLHALGGSALCASANEDRRRCSESAMVKSVTSGYSFTPKTSRACAPSSSTRSLLRCRNIRTACNGDLRPRAQPFMIRADRDVPQRLCLIDSHNLAYRMYFGMKELNGPNGEAVHAVLGFCNKILELRKVFPDHTMLAVFDAGKSEARTAMSTDYKAGRALMPDPLSLQLLLISEAMEAFGVTKMFARGYEADDVIATVVSAAVEQRAESVVVVSSDKDLLQLVSSADATCVRVYDDRKKLLLDAAAVAELHGVEPHQMVDYLAMVGDSSDNVAGIPGIGPKSAAKLLAEHETLDAVLSAAPLMKKSKRQQALVDHAEQARLAKRLITLQSDVPGIEWTAESALAAAEAQPTQLPLLRPFLQKHGFKVLERKLFGSA